MSPSDHAASDKLWTAIIGLMAIIQTVGLGIAAWLLLAVTDLQTSIAAMKADRFTIQDGFEMEKKNAAELLGIWRQIEAVKSDVRSLIERKP